ncbi:MAG: branched-chain amino acid ABC transporter permease [Anaerolineae bacterium]
MRRTYAGQSLRKGMIVGAVLVFVAVIGALTVFGKKPIIQGLLSLTQVILVVGGFAAGNLAQSESRAEKHMASRLAFSGALSGGVAMLLLALLAALVHSVDMRRVLVNATPEMVAVLTFGRTLPVGMALLVLSGIVLGAVGALWSLVARRWQQIASVAVATVIAIGILRDKGLTLLLAVLLLLVVAALTYGYSGVRSLAMGRYQRFQEQNQKLARFLVWGAGLIFLLVLPQILGIYGTSVVDLVGLYALMGLGLNIVVGYAGLLDLGYVAFFAIGAYAMGLLTSPKAAADIGLSFWLAWPLTMMVAATAGALLGVPVLRMRGDYLAIVTLGFGEITRILLLSDTFKSVLGGAQGIIEIPGPVLGGFSFVKPQHFYYLILLGCLVTVVISLRLADSRIGRAWMAMREDEDVAEATGINLVKYKLLAFALGASFSGIGGAIFASWVHAVFPNSFTLLVSINILSLIIVGGIGSIPGVILGAFVLVGLPEVLREFAEFRMLSFGALLVIMMLARPAGLWPAQSRRRELTAEASEV